MNQSENLYQKDMQCVLEFLCQRDVDCLDLESVKKWFGGETATAVVVFGNELPQTAEAGCLAFLAGLGERLVFCGGTGHSTELLKKRAGADERYRECAQKTSEAAVFSEIAVKRYGIPEDKILLDETSANCGENAANARMILEGRHILPSRLILMQDPLMQRRSAMSLKKAMPDSTRILSYAPFLPQCDGRLNPLPWQGAVWERERFLELALGEIPRLRDDENGYGPNGKGFIGHVEIPEEVETAWKRLYDAEADARRRCRVQDGR